MRKIKSGNFIDLFQEPQWDYAKLIVTRPLSETFGLIEATSAMPGLRDAQRQQIQASAAQVTPWAIMAFKIA